MMGLLSPPAVMRLFALESTPVRSAVAVGHKVERTCRVTCWDARAVSRATEICGLFFNASASACFKDRGICAPGLTCESENGRPFAAILGAVWWGTGCGPGAEGNLCTDCG